MGTEFTHSIVILITTVIAIAVLCFPVISPSGENTNCDDGKMKNFRKGARWQWLWLRKS